MSTPKEPAGNSDAAAWAKWVHRQIIELQPKGGPGIKVNKGTNGTQIWADKSNDSGSGKGNSEARWG